MLSLKTQVFLEKVLSFLGGLEVILFNLRHFFGRVQHLPSTDVHVTINIVKKGKVFPYSLPSVGPGADPGVQAVSPQVT